MERPTEKQIQYAKYLSERMCEKLPSDFTKEAYSTFISQLKPIVDREDKGMNENEWAIVHGYI